MDGILNLIQEYGDVFYAITFFWTFLEGETFVIFAGLAAANEILDIRLLIAAAWIGSFCGDQTWFILGRHYGRRLLVRYPRFQPGVDASLRWLERWNTLFILSFRFIYGVRNFASFAMGMSGMSWARFAFLNFIAAGVWAVAFAGAGYLFGQALGVMIGKHMQAFSLGILGLFVVVIGTKILLHYRRRAPTAGNVAD
ncbi:MAG TPA: DedA family protein [Azospirillaceae bacterium]|nr:DedA family protein [Azospirillaceae bacterium]